MFGSRNKRSAALQVVSARPLLNLGCGAHFHPDWTNADIVPADPRVLQHDLRKPLPFAEASFTAVYHSHVLEHLPPREGEALISECRRVLKPGGVLRVVVPDLEEIARLYLENLGGAWSRDPEATARHEWMILELIDQLAREKCGGEMLRYWRQTPMPAESFVIARMGREVLRVIEKLRSKKRAADASVEDSTPAAAATFRNSGEVHRWMYDRVSLRALLEKSDFAEMRICSSTESRIPDFASFGLDASDGEVRKPDSLFVEAIVPIS